MQFCRMQIFACFQQLAHIMDATALVVLIRSPPRMFHLVDEDILMAEVKPVNHGF